MKEMLSFDCLQGCKLFSGFSQDEIDELLCCIPHIQKSYNKGDVVLNLGSKIEHMALVLDGGVILYSYDFLGNKNIMGYLTQYDSFAEAFAITKSPVSIEVSACQQHTRVLFLNLYKMTHLCENRCYMHQKLQDNLLKGICQKIMMLNEKNAYLSLKSVREKIICFLTNQSIKNNSDEFDIMYNREELAEYLRIDRTVLSKHLSLLQKEGIILFHKNHFKLLVHE